MELIHEGLTTSVNPFITTILAPQLKQRQLPLKYVPVFDEILANPTAYFLTDADTFLPRHDTETVQSFFLNGTIGIALLSSHDYKKKITLLDLGFSHCLELPTATEVIIKTIENAVRLREPTVLRDSSNIEYGNPQIQFQYLFDRQGNTFLQHGSKAVFLSKIEKEVLEYLQKRKGFSALNELAYAGWKTFDIKPNTVTVTIKKIRQKLTAAKLGYTIRNLYGYGYILEPLAS